MEAWKEELYHHGIKGQRWGVRRYQNEDGSLTSEGKRHYSGEVMEQVVDGRRLFASKEERIARGKELKSEGRTMVGAYGRLVGRSIVSGALATGVNALCNATGLEAGKTATNIALSTYGLMSVTRFVQDVRDISAYNSYSRRHKNED